MYTLEVIYECPNEIKSEMINITDKELEIPNENKEKTSKVVLKC